MHLSKLDDLEPFTTLDGSTIREIAGPAWTPARNQSLAQATVPVGGRTVAHYHRVTEELYFFTAGRGRMTLGDEEREVGAGESVLIAGDVPHEVEALEDSVVLDAFSPRREDWIRGDDAYLRG